MRRTILIITAVLVWSVAFGQFEKLITVEKSVFGFQLSSKNSFEERLDIAEIKVFGKKSGKAVLERETDLYNIIFTDGRFYSLITKTGNIEEFLFKKKYLTEDLITRIERIEKYLFNKLGNSQSLTVRVKAIYKFLAVKESDFILKGTALTVVDNIHVKGAKEYVRVKKGDVLDFVLLDDIDGIALKGDIVSGYVKEIKGATLTSNEEITILFTKIINSDNREYDIYKEVNLTGDKGNLIGGKTLDLTKVIFIE